MYVIGSDNDKQDNNYTKPSSSITVTYHLNNQALNRQRCGDERKDAGLGLLPRTSVKAHAALLLLHTPCHGGFWWVTMQCFHRREGIMLQFQEIIHEKEMHLLTRGFI